MHNLVFTKKYTVRSYETDTGGTLSATGLMNFLQDIASTHASKLHFGKDDLEKDNRFWVLSRILCEIDRLPDWNEELIVKTWPRGVEKLFAIRDFSFSDSQGSRIGGAASCWIMVDLNTRRPVRPDDVLTKLDGDLPNLESIDRLPGKLEPASSAAYRSQIQGVKYSDLDINMHVNNVKYLQWTLDTYPLDFRMKNRVISIEVNYLSETVPGDEIVITAEESDNHFSHSIIKNSDAKEVCRIRLKWNSCDALKVY